MDDQLSPMLALATAATVTSSINLGTLVLCNGLRNPVVVADEALTIGAMSAGRMELGLGAGWKLSDYRTSSWGRCAGPPWRRENGVALVRDADVSVMPCELVDQYGAGGHRQELSIVAVSTRVRLLSPVVPPDGRVRPIGSSLGRVHGVVA